MVLELKLNVVFILLLIRTKAWLRIWYGYVSKQKYRIWSKETLHCYEEIVWCVIHVSDIIDFYFIQNAQEESVTVNEIR